MALQTTTQPETSELENGIVQFIHGYVCDAAYVRVSTITLIGKTAMKFLVLYFPSAERITMNFYSKEYSAPYDLDGPNPIRQAYLHLKTLPEFAGATDC
jgi:hypothetical protein